MERRLALPSQTRSINFRAASFNEFDNTVDVIWTTGATVRRNSSSLGFYDEVLIVSPASVRLGRLNLGAPFLNAHADHDLSNVIGSVVPGSAKIANGQGFATIKLSSARSDADVVHKIKDGIVRNVSVGYSIHRVERVKRDGEVPLWRVVDWEPNEISAVPVPADAGAQVRGKARTYPCSISTRNIDVSVRAARMRMRQTMYELGLPGFAS